MPDMAAKADAEKTAIVYCRYCRFEGCRRSFWGWPWPQRQPSARGRRRQGELPG